MQRKSTWIFNCQRITILQRSYYIYCSVLGTWRIMKHLSVLLETSSILLLHGKGTTDTQYCWKQEEAAGALRSMSFYIIKTTEKPEMGTVQSEGKDFTLEIHFLLWNIHTWTLYRTEIAQCFGGPRYSPPQCFSHMERLHRGQGSDSWTFITEAGGTQSSKEWNEGCRTASPPCLPLG